MSRISLLALLFSGLGFSQKSSLPDGPGKVVVQRICAQCHAVEIFTVKGNTRDGWTEVVSEMISRGAQGTDEEFGTVVDYLTTHFPPKADPKKP